jgi:hypothetical protein
MSPSSSQLKNLSEMTEILSGNWKAGILAHSLWHFFNYQLYCTIREDDGKPNRYWIDGFDNPEKIDEIRVGISLRRNERREEGLVHELLHVNLIPLGYPRFWIDEADGSDRRVLAGGIINKADHVLIEPIYLSLGYSAGRFLGPSRPPTDLEKEVAADIEMMTDLATPARYLSKISAYLKSRDIRFRPLNLPDTIVKGN